MVASYQHGCSPCINYENGNHPTIRTYKIKKGDNLSFLSEDTWIVYVVEGQLEFSFGEHIDKTISKNEMVVFLSGFHGILHTKEDSHTIAIKINTPIQLCNCFSIESLLDEKDEKETYELTILKANTTINDYMRVLDLYVGEGFTCCLLIESKVRELFYLLQKYYSKKELFHFFYFYLTNDMGFSNLVKMYSFKAKSIQELADQTNYSLSGFRKRFKRVFGVSVYQWMTEQRSKNILHEIVNSQKSLKEISDEYGFSSPSHFNAFCKNRYKATPGAIRKRKKK